MFLCPDRFALNSYCQQTVRYPGPHLRCEQVSLHMTQIKVPGRKQTDRSSLTFSSVGPRGRNCSVSTATRYGLDGPGIESRWRARFSKFVQTGPGAHPASYTMGTGSFPGVKWPRRGADHPPPSKCRGQTHPLGLRGLL